MKTPSAILFLVLFSTFSNVFGQKISDTNFAPGISKTSSPVQQQYWGEDPPPTYLTFHATKSWSNKAHQISLRKEAGLNLQYSNINLRNGGLGSSNQYTGNIFSLFVNAALQARFQINSTLAIGFGPELEILLIGNNKLDYSYYTMLNYPEKTSGEKRIAGLNRDYFNQPTYGIKLSLFETGINEKTTIGINLSYLWTKSEFSNFYAANYTRISFFIGFRKYVDEKPLAE